MLSKVPNMAPPYVDDMFAYMVHIGRVSVDYISSKAPDMGSPPYVDDMLTYIWYILDTYRLMIACQRRLIWGSLPYVPHYIICTKMITIQWLFLSSLQAYCKFIIILITCLRQNLTFLTSACIWYFPPFPSSCWPPLRNAATAHQELTNSYVCMWDRGCDQNAFLSIISSGFWSCSTNRCSPPMPL